MSSGAGRAGRPGSRGAGVVVVVVVVAVKGGGAHKRRGERALVAIRE